MKIKVTGGHIERGDPWRSWGSDDIKYKTIAYNEYTQETEIFWTEGAARHALHVVDEQIMSEKFRLSA